MKNKEHASYCTIDHANKVSDADGFSPYKFWLLQQKRRDEIAAEAQRRRNSATAIRSKRCLT